MFYIKPSKKVQFDFRRVILLLWVIPSLAIMDKFKIGLLMALSSFHASRQSGALLLTFISLGHCTNNRNLNMKMKFRSHALALGNYNGRSICYMFSGLKTNRSGDYNQLLVVVKRESNNKRKSGYQTEIRLRQCIGLCNSKYA